MAQAAGRIDDAITRLGGWHRGEAGAVAEAQGHGSGRRFDRTDDRLVGHQAVLADAGTEGAPVGLVQFGTQPVVMKSRVRPAADGTWSSVTGNTATWVGAIHAGKAPE